MLSWLLLSVCLGLLALSSAQENAYNNVARYNYTAISPDEYPSDAEFLAVYFYEETPEDTLKILNRQLDTLEAREHLQRTWIASLAQTVSANSDVVANFKNNTALSIEVEQQQQNDRLDELYDRLSEIRALMDRVNAIQDRYDNARSAVVEIYSGDRNDKDEINRLEDSDIERGNNLGESHARTERISDRVDDLLTKSWNNSASASYAEKRIHFTTNAVNARKIFNTSFTLYPFSSNGGRSSSTSIDFHPDFIGVPISMAAPIGFKLVKKHGGQYGDQYGGGYACLSWDMDQALFENSTKVKAEDMSTGGWGVERLDVKASYIYMRVRTP